MLLSHGLFISEENFMPNVPAIVSPETEGKHGKTGNNNIGNYASYLP
jgi:hypothetical protein